MLLQRRLVVVIGIDDYEHQPRLRCAVSDALGMQELLVERFGFEAPIPPLTNDAATKPAIEALVEDQLRKLVGPDDALVVFFAGHGTTRTADVSGMRIEVGYLAPVEARGFDNYSDLVNMEELLRKIGLLPARHILVVLDACHSGMALGSAVTQYRSTSAFSTTLLTKRSRRLITSARRDESAQDNGPIPGHSLFTGTLMQALLSWDADLDGNGIVTFSELALCVQQRVVQASSSRQTPDYGVFHLDDRGDFVLFNGNPGEQARVALREPYDASDGRDDSGTLDGKPDRDKVGGRARRALLGAGVMAAAGVTVALGLAPRELPAPGELRGAGLVEHSRVLSISTSAPSATAAPAPSQMTRQSYAGVVRDRNTKAPIRNARLILLGTSCTRKTNEFGAFDFDGCALAERLSHATVRVEIRNHAYPEVRLLPPPSINDIRVDRWDCGTSSF